MSNEQQPTLLDNWIGWLQARIPVLKESHNVYWLKQALEGFRANKPASASNSQVEPINGTKPLPSAEQFLKTLPDNPDVIELPLRHWKQIHKWMESYAELVRQNEREKWEEENNKLKQKLNLVEIFVRMRITSESSLINIKRRLIEILS